MKVLGWIAIGFWAFVWTYVTLTAGRYRDIDRNQLAIIAGLAGMFSWLLFAYFSLEIVIYDSAGSPTTERFPAMAAYGLMMAVPNLYIALTGPLEIVRERSDLQREVT